MVAAPFVEIYKDDAFKPISCRDGEQVLWAVRVVNLQQPEIWQPNAPHQGNAR